jgi:copper chaperone CopZ
MRTALIAIIVFLSMRSIAQQTVTSATFIVKGNCEECKAVIENAADIKGVKILTWNQKTKVATVSYQSDKVTIAQIQQAIAAKGYDTGEYKGNDKAYKQLPKCCKYRDNACKE